MTAVLKKKKTPNSSKSTGTGTNKPSPVIIDSYLDMVFMRERPVARAFLEGLATAWVEWAKKDDSLRVKDFFIEQGISSQKMYEWISKYDFLKSAHGMVMEMIASRREKGAITRKYDGGFIKEMQSMYDPGV